MPLLLHLGAASVSVKPVRGDLQQLAFVLTQMPGALVAVMLDKLQQGFGQRQPSIRLIGRHAEKLPAALGDFLPDRFQDRRPALHRCRYAEPWANPLFEASLQNCSTFGYATL